MSCSNKREYTVVYRCARCGKKQSFVSTRKFRVNANRNRLDVWLIYQCVKCRHTLNIPIFERLEVGKLPPVLYEKFLNNDKELAIACGSDLALFRRGRFPVEKG